MNDLYLIKQSLLLFFCLIFSFNIFSKNSDCETKSTPHDELSQDVQNVLGCMDDPHEVKPPLLHPENDKTNSTGNSTPSKSDESSNVVNNSGQKDGTMFGFWQTSTPLVIPFFRLPVNITNGNK